MMEGKEQVLQLDCDLFLDDGTEKVQRVKMTCQQQ